MSITQENLMWLTVSFEVNAINLQQNGEQQKSLCFNFQKPNEFVTYCDKNGIDVDKVYAINYHAPSNSISWSTDGAGGTDRLEYPDSDYDRVVAPFVALCEAELARQEQEQEQARLEYAKFENRQFRAYDALNAKYDQVTAKPYVKSSVGFDIDANVNAQVAIMGLIERGQPVDNFRDYHNLSRSVDVAKLKIMSDEISKSDEHLKQQKWANLELVKNAYDNPSLDEALAQVKFTYLDFTTDPVGEIEVENIEIDVVNL